MDSNHGPPRYKLGALPTELYALTVKREIPCFGIPNCIVYPLKRKPLVFVVYTTDMTINEFTAKKIGEVLAFTRVSADTIAQGHAALVQALGEEVVQDMLNKARIHGEELVHIATDGGAIDTTLAKAVKTAEKLKQMRDLYVGDQWDNATELLEWSGFFEGAAIVHWALVRGAGERLDNEALMTLANEAVTYHYELLDKSESELASVGQTKSTL